MYRVTDRVAVVQIRFSQEQLSSVFALITAHNGDVNSTSPITGQPDRTRCTVMIPIENEVAFLAGLRSAGIRPTETSL